MATVDTRTHGLTAEERETYAKDGFFIRPKAFDTYEIDALRDRIEDLVELIETSDVLPEKQKQAILKRNVGTEATSGTCIVKQHNATSQVQRIGAIPHPRPEATRGSHTDRRIGSILSQRPVLLQTSGHRTAHRVASGLLVLPKHVCQQHRRRDRTSLNWNLAGTG